MHLHLQYFLRFLNSLRILAFFLFIILRDILLQLPFYHILSKVNQYLINLLFFLKYYYLLAFLLLQLQFHLFLSFLLNHCLLIWLHFHYLKVIINFIPPIHSSHLIFLLIMSLWFLNSLLKIFLLKLNFYYLLIQFFQYIILIFTNFSALPFLHY